MDAVKNDSQSKSTFALSDERAPPRPSCRFWESGICRNGKNCRFAHPGPTETPDRISEPVPTSHHSSPVTSPTPDTPTLSISDDGITTPTIADSKEDDNGEVKIVVSNESRSILQYDESTDNQLGEKIADNSRDNSLQYRVWENHPHPEIQNSGDSPTPQRLEEWEHEALDGAKEGIENGETTSNPQRPQEWGEEPLTSSPCSTVASAADAYDGSELGETRSAQDGEITVDLSSGEYGNPEPLEDQTTEVFHTPEQDVDPLDPDSTWVQGDSRYLIPDPHTETNNTSYPTEAEGSESATSANDSDVPHLDVTATDNVHGDCLSLLSNDDGQWPNNYRNPALPIPPVVGTQHWSQYADPNADLRVPFCRFHAQGQCSQGNACRFRHSLSPNEYALLFHDTQPQLNSFAQPINNAAVVSPFNVCKFYPLGKCRNRGTCPYLHVPVLPDSTKELHPVLLEAERRLQPCRYYSILGHCNRGDQCYYNHDIKSGNGSTNNEDRVEGSRDHAQWSENQQVLDGAQGPNRPCKWFREGDCQYGDKCKFLHEFRGEDNSQREGSPSSTSGWSQHRGQWNEVQEGRNGESRLCKWYREGNCRLGDRCKLLHDSRQVEETGNTDDRSSARAERSPKDDDANDGSWGSSGGGEDSRGGWGNGWASQAGENAQTLEQEQRGADDSIAEASADIDDGWNANAAGWGNTPDEWPPKEENADEDSIRHSDQSSLNGSTFKNRGKFDATSQSRSQCKDYARGRCRRGKNCSFSHDITDGQNAKGKTSSGRRQAIAEKDGWVQTPHEDEYDPWLIKEPCPYYKRGYCKKGMRCNLSHTPNGTPKGGIPRRATPQSMTPSWTPMRPRSAEPSQPVSQNEELPTAPVIDGGRWQTPQGDAELDLTPTDAGEWPDSEPENEHAPWTSPTRPVCHYFLQGRCKKGDKCPNRHETSSGKSQDGGEALITTKTHEPEERSKSGPSIEYSEENPNFTEQVKEDVQQALGDELGPAAQIPPSSKDDSDEQIVTPDDEKTWSADWPQPDTESLPLPKIQAPCKAFGQGHCPMGDSCRYLHVVETIVEDQGPVCPPGAAPIEEELRSDETEGDGVREGSLEEAATDEVPAIETAVEEEGELVVERTFFNCTVQFGLDNGCSPTEIVAASDTYHAIISNLPSNISQPEAAELIQPIDEDNGLQALELDPDQTKARVIARFTTPRQAENAVVKLYGQMFDSRPLVTWRTEESIQPPLEARTVRIKWSAPSRSAWFYYSKVSLAKAHEKRLDGMNVDGRKIKAEFARPRSSDTTYAVKVSGFHINTDEQEYKKLAQDTSLVHKNAPTYIECPLDNIRDTLAARCSLERFYRLPLDPKSAKHTAFARFEDDLAAVLDAHGKQQAYLGKGSLSLQMVFHANHRISDRTYQAVSAVLEKLNEAVAGAQCTLDVYYGTEPPVDIHLYADAASVTAAAFGEVNRALYNVLLGEVMMTEEDPPVPIWDEYFEMTSSSRAIEKLSEDKSFFVKVDKRRRLVMVLGDETSRAKARKGILKLLKMVRAQRHVIPLDLRGIRILVDGGYARLQEELRGAHKVTLDLAVPELVVWGDAELKMATATLAAAASSESPLTADVDDTEDCCFVCKRRPREPVKLSCTHVYCTACLQYVLLASAGAHFVPPRCLAGCEEYIPYVTVRDVLPMAAEAALLENAFLAYVRAKEEEYFFCPLPSCKTVFRRLAEGRVGSVCYTCASCMRKVCAMCGEEYHEGIDCTARDNSIG